MYLQQVLMQELHFSIILKYSHDLRNNLNISSSFPSKYSSQIDTLHLGFNYIYHVMGNPQMLMVLQKFKYSLGYP